MKKLVAILVLLFGTWPLGMAHPSTVLQQGEAPRQASLTREQWRQDLQYLARELPRRHRNAFHTVSREQFERAVAELGVAIPSLQDHEIIIGLMRILAMVGDAHTSLSMPRTFRRYPLNLYWFGNELRVTRTTSASARALGARVVGIGELSVEDAAARLNGLIANENEYWVRYLNGLYMPYAEALHALRILPEVRRGRWTFEDAQGRFSLDMETISQEGRIEWLSTLREAPLYRQRQDEPIWFTTIPNTQTVYVSLQGNPENRVFDRVSDELFREIDRLQANRVIVDFRLNRGGDFNKVRRFLIPRLRQRPAFRRRGSLFVITGRATQSAAMVNSIDLRRELNAILVGEPTGGRPNSYSENDRMRLPNSQMGISYSTRYYQFQEQDTPAVMPDQMIETTWDAYRAGRDPVMEWILAQPIGQ
jgi:hypothetical protein